MDGILLVSNRTYSLSEKADVTKWFKKAYSRNSMKIPRDFELRCMNADLEMRSLSTEFSELAISWTEKCDIIENAERACGFRRKRGLTDIAWYSHSLKLAFVLESHRHTASIFRADSVEEVIEKLS